MFKVFYVFFFKFLSVFNMFLSFLMGILSGGGASLGGVAKAQNKQICFMGAQNEQICLMWPLLVEAHRHKMNRFAS